MDTRIDTLSVAITADTSRFRRELGEADRLARGFGASLTGALESAVLRGGSLGEVLRGLADRLSRLALDAALQPLESGIASAVSGLLGGVMPFARGGVLGPNGAAPFAQGGVFSGPTLFGYGGARLGVLGERGPEAVMPLARGADGRLGVRTGGAGRPVNVSVTVQARDLDSFRRSEGELTAQFARAVARGGRHL